MTGIRDVIGTTRHVLSEFEADTREGAVVVRWRHLPMESSHDPDVTFALTWFLDVDSYKGNEAEMIEFKPEEVAESVFGLAGRAYSISSGR